MPIYEYRCESCGHYLDALQKINDDPLKDCPACNEAALKRLISAPSFRLKGSGWYETDFKSDKDRRRNLAESGGESSRDKSASGSGDKPAADKSASDNKSSGEKKSESSKSDNKKTDGKKSKGSGSEAA